MSATRTYGARGADDGYDKMSIDDPAVGGKARTGNTTKRYRPMNK